MDLNEAYRVLGVSPGDPLEDIQKKYHTLAKRCHPDSRAGSGGGDDCLLDFAQVSQAYRAVERDRREASDEGSCVSGGLGGMPVAYGKVPTRPEKAGLRVLSFVSNDGKKVRQEIRVRQEKNGRKEVMAVDLPQSPSPEPDHEMTADTEAEPAHEFAGEREPEAGEDQELPQHEASLGGGEGYDYGWSGPGAPPLFRPVEPAPAPGSWEPSGDALLPEETAGQSFYLQKDSSREAVMPMFHNTLTRIPF